MVTASASASASTGLVPPVRVEAVIAASDEASMAEGRDKQSGSDDLAAKLVVHSAIAGSVGAAASALGVETWKSALKENSSPVRELGSADLSPGKRMAEKWLNERKSTVGTFAAGGHRDGGSSPMFL